MAVIMFFLTLAVYYLPSVSPTDCEICATGNFLIPAMVVANVILAVVLAFTIPYVCVLPVFSIILGYKYIVAFFCIGSLFTGQGQHNHALKVLTYNVRVFNSFKHYRSDEKYSSSTQMLETIINSGADVVCLQEFYEDKKSTTFNTVKKLQDQYPYYYQTGNFKNKYGQSFGLATFSKHKIIGKGYIKFDNPTKNHGSYIKIVIKGDTLRVFNLHLQSMHIDEDRLTDTEWSMAYGKSIWDALQKFTAGTAERAEQWQTIESYLNPQKNTIICGDFNETPFGYLYHHLLKTYKNSFQSAGWGVGATYNGLLPVLRIDHQFYSSGLKCTLAKVNKKANYSDHYPLTCVYQFKKDNF